MLQINHVGMEQNACAVYDFLQLKSRIIPVRTSGFLCPNADSRTVTELGDGPRGGLRGTERTLLSATRGPGKRLPGLSGTAQIATFELRAIYEATQTPPLAI